MKTILPKPWPEFLAEVDAALDGRIDLHCVGGFIFVFLYGAARATADLDYISVRPPAAAAKIEEIAGLQSKLAKKYKVFLQDISGITDFPENYENRLQKIDIHLRKLHLWALYALWEKEMKPWIARAEWHEQTLMKVWRTYFEPPHL